MQAKRRFEVGYGVGRKGLGRTGFLRLLRLLEGS